MATVVGALAELGYGWSYRVLDSQYFGVAQRRRRVFIVGHLGGFCPPEILFEPESVPWHPRPSRTGARVAPILEVGARTSGDGYRGEVAPAQSGNAYIGVAHPDPAYALADNSGQRTGSGRDAQDTFVISHAPRRLTPTERRLTPTECERLQNFPDGWTAWGVKDGERIDIKDGPRYRMLGNAVTASVAEWVGQRIMAVN
jgi:DNA (cytosine-5)-methyltransferase 1